ncbi:hypothetical protein [Anaerotruncus colihominis]|uniref:hypothetical protein n=1 Tax=Anaerotruncus colihominis TaxID=169435 RepID=UPI0013A62F27|nr:hypothetical protein [Anaerotruncus colihominis]
MIPSVEFSGGSFGAAFTIAFLAQYPLMGVLRLFCFSPVQETLQRQTEPTKRRVDLTNHKEPREMK